MTWLSTSFLCLRFQMQMYWTFYAAGTSRSAPMYFQEGRRMIVALFNHFLPTFETQPPKRFPGTCLCMLLKKNSPGTIRYLGNCNQCCWTCRCYSCNTPAPSCLWSVCTLARGQHAAHVCSAVSIYHHHYDSRAPSALSIFLLSNHECLM